MTLYNGWTQPISPLERCLNSFSILVDELGLDNAKILVAPLMRQPVSKRAEYMNILAREAIIDNAEQERFDRDCIRYAGAIS